jgi:hypothetical protein
MVKARALYDQYKANLLVPKRLIDVVNACLDVKIMLLSIGFSLLQQISVHQLILLSVLSPLHLLLFQLHYPFLFLLKLYPVTNFQGDNEDFGLTTHPLQLYELF